MKTIGQVTYQGIDACKDCPEKQTVLVNIGLGNLRTTYLKCKNLSKCERLEKLMKERAPADE